MKNLRQTEETWILPGAEPVSRCVSVIAFCQGRFSGLQERYSN
jgi:hypothetical protein